jgi:hypothetical protein
MRQVEMLREFCCCVDMPKGIQCPPCRAIALINVLGTVAKKSSELLEYADVDPPDFAQHLQMALDNFNKVYDSGDKQCTPA